MFVASTTFSLTLPSPSGECRLQADAMR